MNVSPRRRPATGDPSGHRRLLGATGGPSMCSVPEPAGRGGTPDAVEPAGRGGTGRTRWNRPGAVEPARRGEPAGRWRRPARRGTSPCLDPQAEPAHRKLVAGDFLLPPRSIAVGRTT